MTAIRKGANGLWQFDGYVEDRDGQRRRIRMSLGTKDRREAEKASRRLRREAAHTALFVKGGGSGDKRQVTFDEWARTWFKDYVALLKYSTAVSYESLFRLHLYPFFKGARLSEIKPQDVQRLIRVMLEKERTRKTVNNALGVLRSMFRAAQVNGHIDRSPMEQVKMFKIPKPRFRYYTEQQSQAFLEVCRQTEPRAYPVFLTLFTTGLRFGEAAALTWDQVDFVRNVIIVDRALYQGKTDTPKGGEGREVPLHPMTRETLLQHRQLRHLKADLVFPGRLSENITDSELMWPLKRVQRRAGLPFISFHDMRHSYASQLVARGVSLYIVQKLLGHKHIETTMRYAHLSPEAKDEAVQKLYSDVVFAVPPHAEDQKAS